MEDIVVLIAILKNNTLKQKELASMLNTSQQTISYKIKKLKEKGYINEKGVTEQGMEYLLNIHKSLSSSLFKKNIKIKGKVFSGVGEGGKFLSLKEYKKQIKEKIGFDPYPGTLNIKLEEGEVERRASLPSLEFEYIKGFVKRGKVYGGAYLKKAYINGVEGAIIIPVKSRYGYDVLEIISPHYLRKKLKIRDNECVEVVL